MNVDFSEHMQSTCDPRCFDLDPLRRSCRVMAQRSLFSYFGKRSADSEASTSAAADKDDEIEKKERRKKQKSDYEEERERRFQFKWLKEFSWLTVNDEKEPTTMFCQVSKHTHH